MFHPIGSLPAAVYWRRRVMVGATLAAVLLAVMTVFALVGHGQANVASNGPIRSSTTAGAAAGAPSSTVASTLPDSSPALTASTTPAAPAGSSSSSAPGSSGAPTRCIGAQLTVAAATGAPSYRVGQEPTLILEVTDNGPADCTQNLADSQVELRVYNGAARVWGSHDCQIQPGIDVKTLAVGTTVGVQVVWSGLSSQPKCAGTRQRVGAGTYTLYALLGGVQGVPVHFTLT